MKTCSKCNTPKEDSEFYRETESKGGGLRPHCKDCFKEYTKVRKEKNPEKFKAIGIKAKQVWNTRNPGRMKELQRRFHLKTCYGLSPADYEIMSNHQYGRCAICGLFPPSGKLVVDHCHKTDAVRGLLCNGCNMGLGGFKDLAYNLLNAVEYLKGAS